MTLYMVLFLLGFILAIGLLAYTSTQITELSKKAESFNASLVERYSKPLKELALQDIKAEMERKAELDKKSDDVTDITMENKAEKQK